MNVQGLLPSNDLLKVTTKAFEWGNRTKLVIQHLTHGGIKAFYPLVQYQGFVTDGVYNGKMFLKPVTFLRDSNFVEEIGQVENAVVPEVLEELLLTGQLEYLGQFTGVAVKPNPPPSVPGQKEEDTCTLKDAFEMITSLIQEVDRLKSKVANLEAYHASYAGIR